MSIKEQAIQVFKMWLNDTKNGECIELDWIRSQSFLINVLEKYPYYKFNHCESSFQCKWWGNHCSDSVKCPRNINKKWDVRLRNDFKEENLLCIFDLAINHHGFIISAFIIDTVLPTFERENEIREALYNESYRFTDKQDSNQFPVYFLDANWILEQKVTPEKIPKTLLFPNIVEHPIQFKFPSKAVQTRILHLVNRSLSHELKIRKSMWKWKLSYGECYITINDYLLYAFNPFCDLPISKRFHCKVYDEDWNQKAIYNYNYIECDDLGKEINQENLVSIRIGYTLTRDDDETWGESFGGEWFLRKRSYLELKL